MPTAETRHTSEVISSLAGVAAAACEAEHVEIMFGGREVGAFHAESLQTEFASQEPPRSVPNAGADAVSLQELEGDRSQQDVYCQTIRDARGRQFGEITLRASDPFRLAPHQLRSLEQIAGAVSAELSCAANSGEVMRIMPQSVPMSDDPARLVKINEAVQALPFGAVTIDALGVIEWVNDPFCRMFGYTADACVGKEWFKLICGTATDPSELHRMRASLKGGRPYRGELCQYHSEGWSFWAETSMAPYSSDPGMPVTGAFIIHTDISERKVMEAALLQSEHLYRSVVENTPSVILATDTNGIVTLLEGKSLLSSGFFAADGIGRPVSALFSKCPGAAEGVRSALEGIPSTGLYGDDAHAQEMAFTPMRDNAGAVTGCVTVAYDVSEHVACEKEILRANRLTEQLLASIPSILIAVDTDGLIRRWNGAAERAFGFTAAEMLGRTFDPSDFLSEPNDVQLAMETLRTSNAPQNIEDVLFIARDGASRYLGAHLNPMFTEEGSPDGFLLLAADITERKRGIQAQARLASIIESSADAIFSMNLTGEITSWNPAAERLYGIKSAKVLGTDFHFIIPDDHIEELKSNVEALTRGERVDYHETVWRRADGTPLMVAISLSPIFGPHRDVIGASCISRDISHQMKLNGALRQSEEHLKIALQVGDMATWRVDVLSGVYTCSEGFERIFGLSHPPEIWTRDEVMPRLIPEDRSRLVQDITQAMNEHSTFETNVQIIREDASVRWIHVKGKYEYNEEGIPVQGSGACVDVTHLKEAELKCELAVKELEKRNWELAEARDAALNAAKYKSEFLANTSHEVRTPLNGVIGMLNLLADTNLTDRQQSYISTMKQSADALMTVINDVLDFSKIEAGKLNLDKQDFSLFDLLEETVQLFAPTAKERSIDLVFCNGAYVWATDHPVARVKGDAGRLRQILSNLLSNAVKFTPTGGAVYVGADLVKRTLSGAEWRISVRDTGIGIAPDRQQAVFQSFTQADGSTTRRYGGTGLGLTICRQLTELMGGKIGLASTSGVGSTFTVDIPFEHADDGYIAYPPPTELFAGTLLITVGESPTLTALANIARSMSGQVVEATCPGKIANGFCEAGASVVKRCLVVVDREDNVSSIGNIITAVKSAVKSADIQYILLTPIGVDLDASSAGADRTIVLEKPIRPRDIMQLVRNHGRASLRTSSPVPQSAPGDTANSGDISNISVLVAEDNTINQMVAVAMLERLGIASNRITVVGDGEAAASATQDRRFDVVFLDIQMPKMDGYQAAAAMREFERSQALTPTPLIAMTAHASTGDREKCLQNGMDDYVCKPVDREALLAALKRQLPNLITGAASAQPEAGKCNEPAVIDGDRLRDASGGDGDLEQKLLQTFLTAAPKMTARCAISAETGDTAGLEYWAHTLKGSARTMGANRLAEACEDLEKPSKRGSMEGIEALVKEVETAWRITKGFIEAELLVAQTSLETRGN